MEKQLLRIEELAERFDPISRETMLRIKGGTCAPWMDPTTLANQVIKNVFNNFDTSRLSLDHLGQVNNFINTLANTQLGQDVLQGLLSSHASINFNDINPTGAQAEAAFSNSTNTLTVHFSDEGSYPNPFHTQIDFTDITHELIHAYQKFVLGDSSATYTKEVDAYLTTAMIDQQVDANKSLVGTAGSYYEDWGKNITNFIDGRSDPTANAIFNSAWNDILSNKNFTTDNFSKLVNNFYDGSAANQGQYSSNNGYSIGDVTNLAHTATHDVFPCFQNFVYKNSGNGSGGSGGGGGGEGGDGGGGIINPPSGNGSGNQPSSPGPGSMSVPSSGFCTPGPSGSGYGPSDWWV